MYLDKCPKCGSELDNYCEWDIVTAQQCSNPNCNFYRSYGTARLYNGETSLVPNLFEEELILQELYEDAIESKNSDTEENENNDAEFNFTNENNESNTEYEDNDEMPF